MYVISYPSSSSTLTGNVFSFALAEWTFFTHFCGFRQCKAKFRALYDLTKHNVWCPYFRRPTLRELAVAGRPGRRNIADDEECLSDSHTGEEHAETDDFSSHISIRFGKKDIRWCNVKSAAERFFTNGTGSFKSPVREGVKFSSKICSHGIWLQVTPVQF